MTPILANAYIPLAQIAPAAQVALLILIIAFETWFIARSNKSKMCGACFWRIAAVNLLTAVIGIGVLVPASMFEAWLLFGWGSQYHINKVLWWLGVWIYGLILPLGVWIVCYHISWRLEYSLLKKWTSDRFPSPSKSSVILAHRWSYAALGLFVLSGCLHYFYVSIIYR
jgi:hypothetical protein